MPIIAGLVRIRLTSGNCIAAHLQAGCSACHTPNNISILQASGSHMSETNNIVFWLFFNVSFRK